MLTPAQSWSAQKNLPLSITTLSITKKTPSGQQTTSFGPPTEALVQIDPSLVVKLGKRKRNPSKIQMFGTHLLQSKRGSLYKKSEKSTQAIKIIKSEIYPRKRKIRKMVKRHFSTIGTLTEMGPIQILSRCLRGKYWTKAQIFSLRI